MCGIGLPAAYQDLKGHQPLLLMPGLCLPHRAGGDGWLSLLDVEPHSIHVWQLHMRSCSNSSGLPSDFLQHSRPALLSSVHVGLWCPGLPGLVEVQLSIVQIVFSCAVHTRRVDAVQIRGCTDAS